MSKTTAILVGIFDKPTIEVSLSDVHFKLSVRAIAIAGIINRSLNILFFEVLVFVIIIIRFLVIE